MRRWSMGTSVGRFMAWKRLCFSPACDTTPISKHRFLSILSSDPSRNTFKIHTNFTYPKDEKYSFACVLILYEEKKKIVDRYTIRPTRIKNNINKLNNVTRVRMQKNVSNVKEGTIYIYIQVQNRIFIIVVSRPRYVSVSRSVFWRNMEK